MWNEKPFLEKLMFHIFGKQGPLVKTPLLLDKPHKKKVVSVERYFLAHIYGKCAAVFIIMKESFWTLILCHNGPLLDKPCLHLRYGER
jgi:hypothetical protein